MYLESHRLPWKADEQRFMSHIFVRDADKKTVVLVPAIETTHEDSTDGDLGIRRSVAKPIAGALERANLFAAGPAMVDAVNGLLGLLTLIAARSDVSAELRDILQSNHRVVDARALVATFAPAESPAQEAVS